ncbi:predicted protein [Histoplasma mississippiense (nom. inval.)]|uniref:predicted protein n=1 Tax=Ajellomyces capsulatus (strain NAm1 / WU24) TaxID=2059318 RepID=UPI000157C284|nr:predicted protein [Histoplasma mississippiense (nom. inval.)]EDN07210.1 predicted protein [Histoplasma mississippiense (nom. inval.)]
MNKVSPYPYIMRRKLSDPAVKKRCYVIGPEVVERSQMLSEVDVLCEVVKSYVKLTEVARSCWTSSKDTLREEFAGDVPFRFSKVAVVRIGRAGLKANRASTVLLELQGGADVARANSIPCNTVLDLFYRSFLGYICIDMSTHLVAPLRDYSPGLVGVEVTGLIIESNANWDGSILHTSGEAVRGGYQDEDAWEAMVITQRLVVAKKRYHRYPISTVKNICFCNK